MNKKLKINLRPLNKRGAVTLATTVVASSMLITLSLASSQLMTREVKMSTRVDSSAKAYFAAEAGVEDALRRLKNNPGFREGNGSFTIFQGSNRYNNVKWIKRNVSDKVFEFTGYLVSTREKEESENLKSSTIDLSGIMVRKNYVIPTDLTTGTLNFGAIPAVEIKKPSYVVIEWNNPLKGDSTNVMSSIGGVENIGLDDSPNYDGPAAIEIGVTSWPSGTIDNSNQIRRNSVFIRPQDATRTSAQNLTLANPFTHRSKRIWLQNVPPIGQDYNISLGIGSYNHILRIKALYNNTNFRVRVYYDNRTPSNFNDDEELVIYGNEGHLQIDVTGYADGAYRRIVVRKPRGGIIYSVFDYVLFSKGEDPIIKGKDSPWSLNF